MGTDPDNITQPVEPEKRLYEYDPIGNRNTVTEGSESSTYAANSLNQYEEVTAGGSSLSLNYDADGNLTAYNGVSYTYNAENRLIAVEPANPVDGDTRVENTYDYQGRRIKKAIFSYSAGSWQLNEEKLFVYDDWNLIEEITDDGSNQTSRYFVWGLDLSQSLQGAGGIGGLLATVDGADTYYFAYDGNGNVGQVVNAADGTIAAAYQYDPFGNLIKAGGAYADDNPYRFSSKYHDDETGLIYYGLRYYEPGLGRWLNRDPLGEAGSLNLYCFVTNNSLCVIDPLGLFNWCACAVGASKGLGSGGIAFFAGIADLIQNLATHPIKTAKDMYSGMASLVKMVLAENYLGATEIVFPELYKLSTEWDNLGEEELCSLIGKIVGEYGAGVLTGVGAAKIIKKLKILNKLDKDVLNIARKYDIDPESLQKIKDYMFKNSEWDFEDPAAKAAWKRLSEGKATDTDKLLLKHEATEMYLRDQKDFTQHEAHERANDYYGWEYEAH